MVTNPRFALFVFWKTWSRVLKWLRWEKVTAFALQMAKPLWALAWEGHKFISFFITVTCLPSLNKGVGGPLPSREHKKYFSSVVVPCARWIENVVLLFAGEKELRTRIKDLIRYRKNGITKLSGIYRLLQCVLANLKVVAYFFNTKLWHWAKYLTYTLVAVFYAIFAVTWVL